VACLEWNVLKIMHALDEHGRWEALHQLIYL
jgi:hypothetical protein